MSKFSYTAKAHQCTLSGQDQKFVSACVHCGKPMASMSIETYESTGAGQVRKRDVFMVWIDPFHECTYLAMAENKPALDATGGEQT